LCGRGLASLEIESTDSLAIFSGHGEIVHLDAQGKPGFYDLMRRRNPQHYYAFDLLWLDDHDLRELPLIKRKQMLKRLIRPPVLYVDHIEGRGVDLFEATCGRDMEGIVAKLAAGRYEPAATTWVKIKNRAYSLAEGRPDFFAVTSTRTKADLSATGAGAIGAYTVRKLLEP
jgi:bifunctional non-homologous end joining protein LigD